MLSGAARQGRNCTRISSERALFCQNLRIWRPEGFAPSPQLPEGESPPVSRFQLAKPSDLATRRFCPAAAAARARIPIRVAFAVVHPARARRCATYARWQAARCTIRQHFRTCLRSTRDEHTGRGTAFGAGESGFCLRRQNLVRARALNASLPGTSPPNTQKHCVSEPVFRANSYCICDSAADQQSPVSQNLRLPKSEGFSPSGTETATASAI